MKRRLLTGLAAAALVIGLGATPAQAYTDSVSHNYGQMAQIVTSSGSLYNHYSGVTYYGGTTVKVPANYQYCRVVNGNWTGWARKSTVQFITIPHGTHNYKVVSAGTTGC